MGPVVPPPIYDFCAQIPSLPVAPVLDGVLEPNLAMRDVVPQRWDGLSAIPMSVRIAFATAWRSDGLYVFARVWDPDRFPSPDLAALWCGDGVELYVDDDGMNTPADSYDRQGTRQFIIAAPVDGSTKSTTAAVFEKTAVRGPWTSTEFGAWPTADGYVVEAVIRGYDLGKRAAWTLVAGQKIGFDLAHNVSHPTPLMQNCGARLGQYFLRVRQPEIGDFTDLPYRTPAAFCTPTLLP